MPGAFYACVTFFSLQSWPCVEMLLLSPFSDDETEAQRGHPCNKPQVSHLCLSSLDLLYVMTGYRAKTGVLLGQERLSRLGRGRYSALGETSVFSLFPNDEGQPLLHPGAAGNLFTFECKSPCPGKKIEAEAKAHGQHQRGDSRECLS